MTMRHEGKTMLVTGAAGAIGLRDLPRSSPARARRSCWSTSRRTGWQRTKQLRDAGHEVIAHHADCADDAQVERYAQAAIDAWGRIDGFFNNAGIEGDLARPTNTTSRCSTRCCK
jgi:NAD(P)-dependent dehydrogenase (short-subunit alcohol dehydrogenase family)